MNIIKVVLNLPLSLAALVAAFLGGIKSVNAHNNPPALIINIYSFWFRTWRKKNKGVRGSSLGNVILLGNNLLPNDLDHELIHIEQTMRHPFIQPILYWVELRKRGYRNNKYEIEAYTKAGNTYLEK
jgi:hypothetical protein